MSAARANTCVKKKKAQQNRMSESLCGQKCCAGFHRVNRKCEECPAGKLGSGCEDDCPPGYFGKMCTKKCICSGNDICSPVNGTCRISNSTEAHGVDGGTASDIVSYPYFVIITFSVCFTVIVVVAMVIFRKKLQNFDNVENSVDRNSTRKQKSTTISRVNTRQLETNSPMVDEPHVYDLARVSKVCSDEMFENTQENTQENKNTRGPGFSILPISKGVRGTAGVDTSRTVMGMDGYHILEIVPGRERDTDI